jgi:hypothetical protein
VTSSRLALLLIGLVLAAGVLVACIKFQVAPIYSGRDASQEDPDKSGALNTANRGFADQLKRDQDSELDVMAIMASEEKSPEGRKALLETMYNRANAHRVTDIQKAIGNRDKATGYYQAFWDGSFEKRRKEIAADPAMQAQLRKEIDEVHAGSNFSNLGTQNASAHKAKEAQANQTITARYPGGDYFSRKDMTEHDNAHGGPHGVEYTRQEQEWARGIQATLDKEAPKQSPQDKEASKQAPQGHDKAQAIEHTASRD